ncbi:MsnO8 family LLM class oxidoreductase [Streptomyces sp. NPDC059443]|uniref:MsnO8 family LLM class oxidoreductase n=1 Tax=unclassified Streptomyces TaxID=2593676 RepID=UPI00367F3612
MPLSVLDQVPLYFGRSRSDALAESVELAKAAEELGCHRFWVAEHHGGGSNACGSPEVLAAAIGAATHRIRVGIGAFTLPLYAPWKVAESIRVLAGLAPGRVDAGICRGPGATPEALAALVAHHDPDRRPPFERLSADLLGLLERYADELAGMPLFVAGSGPGSARLAAALGLPYVFGQFALVEPRPDVVALYREEFRPSPWWNAPKTVLALRVAAADSGRTVDALVAGFAGVMAGAAHLPREARRQLASGALPTMGSCLMTDDRLPPVPEVGSTLVRGDGEELRASLAEHLDHYAPDEVMVTPWSSDLAGRIRALEIIREALPH